MERPDNKPEPPRAKHDFTKPDLDKQQRALARDVFLKAGKVKEFDEAVRQADSSMWPVSDGLTVQARRQKIMEGTVDKDVLAEAASRKMRAGGTRPLKEFVADVIRDRVLSGKKAE